MAKISKHVLQSPKGGWVVRGSDSERSSRVFTSQEEAVRFATNVARKEQRSLYIHGRDGTVKSKRDYGSDHSPKK